MGVKSTDEINAYAGKGEISRTYELIRRILPRERLLEYQLGSGREPLCDFLGKEVPDVEFPKVNETDSMHEKMSIIARRGVRNLLTRVLLWTRPLIVAVLLVVLGGQVYTRRNCTRARAT